MGNETDQIDLTPFRRLVPTQLHFGDGGFDRTPSLIGGLGARALLVTGLSAMRRLGRTQQLTAGLAGEGIGVTQFAGVPVSPATDDVDRGAEEARRARVDFVIGLGGGSVIDCAKAIAAVTPNHRLTIDYLRGKASVGPDTLPIVAIPTTAGTGSEMNKSAIIRDPDKRTKDGIRSIHLFPRLAIVDPRLTYSLSRLETAQSGFDVMTHAVESYVSPKATPETDTLSLMAIRNVVRFLPLALEQADDTQARQKLALSSAAMGINLTSVGTCFPHRADKALCALHPEIPHAQSVALFYPHWIRMSYQGNAGRFADVAELLGVPVAHQPMDFQAAALATHVRQWLVKIGMNKTFRDYGVKEDEIPLLVERVAGDLSVNPIPIMRDQLDEIFRQVLKGERQLETYL